jgi:hypothetical protein
MKLDTERTDSLIAQLEARTLEVKNFISAKLAVIKANENNFDAFAAKFKAAGIRLENMYSTGFNGEDYKTDSQLKMSGVMLLSKQPVNVQLFTKKLDREFNDIIFAGSAIRASFYDYQIKGNVVKFELWVK